MTETIPEPWGYRANISPILTDGWEMGAWDGDSVWLHIDLGFMGYTYRKCRVLGINCPEMKTDTYDAGKLARDQTRAWLAKAVIGQGRWPLRIRSYEADNFGRWLADIWRVVDNQRLTDYLLSLGYPEYQ